MEIGLGDAIQFGKNAISLNGVSNLSKTPSQKWGEGRDKNVRQAVAGGRGDQSSALIL
jgi:hypothetical protein